MNHHPTDKPDPRTERFLALLHPVYERLERFCFAIERDREKACDLIGETILKAWEHFDGIRDEGAFLGWLFTTATRLHRRDRSRGNRMSRLGREDQALLISELPEPDMSADLAALHHALDRLPERTREAIILFEISGFTQKEIAAIQGGSVTAVKVRLHRGRKRLASLLDVRETPEDTGSVSTSAPNQSPDSNPTAKVIL